jgi:MFS family permease
MSSEVRVGLIWRFAFGIGAIVAPPLAYLITALLVEGHAQEQYFEAVSQILPVLLLALAIEQRYFTRAGREPAPETPVQLELAGRRLDDRAMARWYTLAARIYALMVLVILGLGEWIAVEVLATGESTTADLKNTAGSLAAGFIALIVSALVGTKQTTD